MNKENLAVVIGSVEAGLGGLLIGNTLTSREEKLSLGLKVVAYTVGSLAVASGIADSVSGDVLYLQKKIGEGINFLRYGKKKESMSIECAFNQINQKYEERLNNFIEDTKQSRTSYQNKLNAFYGAYCKAA